MWPEHHSRVEIGNSNRICALQIGSGLCRNIGLGLRSALRGTGDRGCAFQVSSAAPIFAEEILTKPAKEGAIDTGSVGAYVRAARNIGGDMLARSEAVLYSLGSSVAVAFIGLVVLAPERVERTMMDILTRIVTAVGISDVP